jgi:GWxTD domain-containing protein
MSRKGIWIALTSFFLLITSFYAAQKDSDSQKVNNPLKVNVTGKDGKDKSNNKKASDEAKKSRDLENASKALQHWLDEDVAYIITPEERKAFKGLKTDEERESFIESFWLRRDPTPDTIDNEYRDEHYERIAYANEHYASGIPGWKTDRGRIYIMYGKPDEIESHPSGGTYDRPIEQGGGTTSTFPFEIWRYRYIEGIGNEVLLEFVDPSMSGEYHMTIDPSEKDALLHVPGAGLTFDEQMNNKDKAERFNRAGASIGNPLGATGRTNPFDQLQLLANIYKPPEVKYKDLEAVITTKLSYNVLPFNYRADFVRVTEDTVLTPITIELSNKDLAFQETDGIHRALAEVLIKITSFTGRVAPNGVAEDAVAVDIADAFFKQSLDGVRIYQKGLLLKPGLYKMDIVVKDKNSGNTGVVNQRLSVPRYPDEKLQLSSIITAQKVEALPPTEVGTAPFAIAGQKVWPNVTGAFLRERDKDINLYFQVYNLKLDEVTHKPSATVEFLITKNNEEVKKIVEQSSELTNAAAQMTVVKAIQTKDLDPGQYAVQVRVTDNLTKDVIVGKESFVVR